MRIVIALGGNALLRRGEHPDAAPQISRLAAVAPALARIANAHEVVLVHGNGPQVGLLASENVADPALSAPYPLSDMVAETQGLIGLWIQHALNNAGAQQPIATIITQTVVDADDPAMHEPTKFVGPILTKAEATAMRIQHGWATALDGTALRRVVASPAPVRIVEIDVIETLLAANTTVIAGGGGGAPVTSDRGRFSSVDAVVDKDALAALLAIKLHADLLLILTDVEGVMENFGTPQEHLISSLGTADTFGADLAPGSMGPKVDAARRFVLATGLRASIGSLENAEALLRAESGTNVVASAMDNDPLQTSAAQEASPLTCGVVHNVETT